MCNTKGNSNDNFLAGIVLGALIGGALGVLFAPDEGKKTRAKLKVKLQEGKYRAEELTDEMQEKLVEIQEKAEPLIAEIREKMEPVLEKVSEVSEPVREHVAQYIDDIRADIVEKESTAVDKMKKRFFKGVRR